MRHVGISSFSFCRNSTPVPVHLPQREGLPLLRTQDHLGGIRSHPGEEQPPRAGAKHPVRRLGGRTGNKAAKMVPTDEEAKKEARKQNPRLRIFHWTTEERRGEASKFAVSFFSTTRKRARQKNATRS